MTAATTCRSCAAPILWTVTPKGARLPVDAPVDPAGNVEIVAIDPDGTLRARVLPDGYVELSPEFAGERHVAHWATCPHADRWRRS